MIEQWPLALVISSGLIAWGETRAKLVGLRKDIDTKASLDTIKQIDAHLTRIEEKLDRFVERA